MNIFKIFSKFYNYIILHKLVLFVFVVTKINNSSFAIENALCTLLSALLYLASLINLNIRKNLSILTN